MSIFIKTTSPNEGDLSVNSGAQCLCLLCWDFWCHACTTKKCDTFTPCDPFFQKSQIMNQTNCVPEISLIASLQIMPIYYHSGKYKPAIRSFVKLIAAESFSCTIFRATQKDVWCMTQISIKFFQPWIWQ